MGKESVSKYHIMRNNGHLLDVFFATSYIELGNIPFETMEKLLRFEVLKLEEIIYKSIQEK
ncbi:MAG TPA: hypothetical protein PLO88_05380, partial [Bacilli bacterium]|nr:hypothetical protein [Bacilli bacterium]